MFGPFPAQLQNAIQQNYLQRAFLDPLVNKLGYRSIAEKTEFPGRIGQSITMTRTGLLVPNITPLDPATNNNLDNGITPTQYATEQFTLSVAQYPQQPMLINLMSDMQTIASFAIRNSMNIGVALATANDRLARASLFGAYLSGNTFITASASSVTQAVDDTRGFQTAVLNGVVTAVGSGNPLNITVNGVANTVIGFANDSVNVSTTTQTGGMSGTITLGTTASTTAGQAVVSVYAPLIVRPNARATSYALQSTDLLTMQAIRSAIASLVNNSVPTVNGAYNLFLNQSSMNQLQQDSEFQLLNRGVDVRDPTYENAWINSNFLMCRFIQTTETYVQAPGAVDGSITVPQGIQRPIVCGKDALVEGIFTAGLDAVKGLNEQMGIGDTRNSPNMSLLTDSRYMNLGYYYHIRPPIDALGQIITQTGNYVGGFTVPTDTTTTPAIIPTASNSYFKRAVIIETAA